MLVDVDEVVGADECNGTVGLTFFSLRLFGGYLILIGQCCGRLWRIGRLCTQYRRQLRARKETSPSVCLSLQ